MMPDISRHRIRFGKRGVTEIKVSWHSDRRSRQEATETVGLLDLVVKERDFEDEAVLLAKVQCS